MIGSIDSTLQIINKYAEVDNRIIIINKKNEGVSIARNKGIERATGEYITFIDADDWLELNAIEMLYSCMLEEKTDVIRARCYINFKENQNEKIENLYELQNKLILKQNINNEVIEHFLSREKPILNLVMLLFIKRNVIQNKIEFNSKLYMMEDVAFYFELFQNIDSIFFLDKPLYHYFSNLYSVTNSSERYLINCYGVLKTNRYLIKLIKRYKCYSKKIEMKINSNHLNIVINYLTYLCMLNNDLYHKEDFFIFLKNVEFQVDLMEVTLNKIQFRNKLAIILLKKKKYNLLYIYLCLIASLKKIKHLYINKRERKRNEKKL